MPELPAPPSLARGASSAEVVAWVAQYLGGPTREGPDGSGGLTVLRGAVAESLTGPLATTWAPVPGWLRHRSRLAVRELHPWPWLVRPRPSSVRSYSAWRKGSGR